ncbi:hypothetical protein STEG23_012032, partial [Scotinomys teguina]
MSQYLVKLKYLEYRQVAGSDPARYEFLWGPQAYAETSKMKVLEYLAKINQTKPSAMSVLYEEAVKDPQEQTEAMNKSILNILSLDIHVKVIEGLTYTHLPKLLASVVPCSLKVRFKRKSSVSIDMNELEQSSSLQNRDRPTSTGALVVSSTQQSLKEQIIRKASVLIEFLLDKFKMKETVTWSEMLAIVNKKYNKERFPEILRRTTACLELVFGIELKEIDTNTHSYMLVGKEGLSTEGSLSSNWRLPKNGLLMSILGVIFMKGKCATEQKVWQFLNGVGVYAGKKHLIFGEPKEFINKHLVQENYLEYRLVPGSDPPTFEFLWGPRAHAETTKMKVLEVLAKVNGTVPSAFPSLYQEALKDYTWVPRSRDQVSTVDNLMTVVRKHIREAPRCDSGSHSPGPPPLLATDKLLGLRIDMELFMKFFRWQRSLRTEGIEGTGGCINNSIALCQRTSFANSSAPFSISSSAVSASKHSFTRAQI